jgi:ribose 5-phosphate isomerase A
MALSYASRQFIKAKGQPIWREGFTTDNGNQIVDVHQLNITNPPEMEERFSRIAGVLTVGIFAHRGADIIISADKSGVKTLQK